MILRLINNFYLVLDFGKISHIDDTFCLVEDLDQWFEYHFCVCNENHLSI